ncbi:MAG TPA: 16S rRNA (adenine(1518)-N(6)/adenine(1519)-N(6))-dimethyltransferase RsmA [Candidatus Elarobacter sp.]|nr:16S rRNA (adenine(1518)-N(6)/adenine(1519)-N(6))-dimethyltransferase RsmA [Candidatus Elarobacter sp.]
MTTRARDGFPPTLKRFGQHFLADRAALERIVAAIDPTAADTVVEIGPGRGALTDLLAPRAGRLIAVELDRALATMLRERFAEQPSVTIVENDILHTDLGALAGADYLLVGNVPYYITTPILFHVLAGALPRRAVFLVQREVADRMMAIPGSKAYGALSVNLQVSARVERVFDVPPGAFRPPPRVDSTVVRVMPLATPLVPAGEQPRLRSFVQSLFSQRRKQLGTILRGLGHDVPAVLGPLGIDPAVRPERLTPEQFITLFRAVRESER